MSGEALAIVGGTGAIGVGLVFLSAGMAKLRNRRIFPGVVENYRLLPPALVRPVAAILPAGEVLTGAALLAGVWLAALPAIALLLIFGWAMAVNIARGRGHIDCGCGRSDLRQPLNRGLVWRNAVLALAVVPALFGLPEFGSAGWWIGAAGGVALFLMVLVVNALSALANGPLTTMMERKSA